MDKEDIFSMEGVKEEKVVDERFMNCIILSIP